MYVVETLKHAFSVLYMASPILNAESLWGKWFKISNDCLWSYGVVLHWCDVYRILFVFVTTPVVTSNLGNLNGELTTFLALSSI